ncbi:thioredoxin family protein [Brevibacillus sp. H7]|uniref:thioredoxin family protein n=1 Tax=Brevibacillus sp. H7 TaxID=3349138 RepID=UPI0037FBD3B2
MSVNLASKWGRGLSPQAFMDGMTKNKEQFQEWYDSFAWEDENDREFFQSLRYRDDLRCMILAADWCGDVVRNVPVLFRALAEAELPVEVLIMEDHLDVMEQFLTMGGRAIPIAIFTDTGGHVLGKWGPRPAHVQAVMASFKQENPDRSAPDYDEKIKAARAEMLKRYGDGTGYQTVIVKELRELLSSF